MTDIDEIGLHDEKTAPDICVDRGQPVIILVTFPVEDNDPEEVYFSCTHPSDERPYVDDGYGQARSKITRIAAGIYRYVIDTTSFAGGDANWHFTGEWRTPRKKGYVKASIFGRYHVNKAPEQLL